MFSNPDIGEICDLLREVRTIAMVGLSPLQKRPSYRIARGLQGAGYKIVPVRPLVPKILGEKAYSSLSDVPDPIDLVHVFRPARFLDAIVDECLARNFNRLWIQEGIINEAAAERARDSGIKVIMDRCIWRDRNGPCEPLLSSTL
ncbi:MAG: CoA-binding protein [Betaproteobacteria bacterium SG8_40]|jgi:predicted CoA-binding protein|nr:MAG: CoA-binding protein [Betaproteobacteria bacterium SG8_40]